MGSFSLFEDSTKTRTRSSLVHRLVVIVVGRVSDEGLATRPTFHCPSKGITACADAPTPTLARMAVARLRRGLAESEMGQEEHTGRC